MKKKNKLQQSQVKVWNDDAARLNGWLMDITNELVEEDLEGSIVEIFNQRVLNEKERKLGVLQQWLQVSRKFLTNRNS